jgi:hypothetical protein
MKLSFYYNLEVNDVQKELDHNFWVLSFISNWRFKQFSLGANLSSEPHETLAEGMTYEMLNYDVEIETIKKREYYLTLCLGYWQLSLGIRI